MPSTGSPLSRRLAHVVSLTDQDLERLEAVHQRRSAFAPGSELYHQGQGDQSVFVLATGWACTCKHLADGRRQIIDFAVPGDIIGLTSAVLRAADHSAEPVTAIEASEVPAIDLRRAFEQAPRLAVAVLWAASAAAAVAAEHVTRLGSRTAIERTAHLLLELGVRLEMVDLADADGYACPLSQYHLADALGLTAVHVNRVLRELRTGGLVTFRNGRVDIIDRPGLVALAGFDPSYLDHAGPLLA